LILVVATAALAFGAKRCGVVQALESPLLVNTQVEAYGGRNEVTVTSLIATE
jgi:hypothetical protein